MASLLFRNGRITVSYWAISMRNGLFHLEVVVLNVHSISKV